MAEPEDTGPPRGCSGGPRGMSGAAYRDRGFGGAAEMDRKRIKEALEKHTERPSPSTSRGASREKELLAAGKITTQIGKVPKVSDVVCERRSSAFSFEIWFGEKRLILGTFDTAEEAARVHDVATWRLPRPCRDMNFPDVLSQRA
ncbi:hypothetical protein TRIUR3_14877 [Triticum urartu]|uniref:Uncharacterized protein n=1 Tax=Triticum urartu TaxID=4572 RepID=M7Y819_TRIUA|nr:hypothetical protein TRIUR3_14877 [Triticum urartu]